LADYATVRELPVHGTSVITELAELGFREAVFGRRRLYLAPAIAGHAVKIDLFLKSMRRLPESASGNRRSAFAVALTDLPLMFIRQYLRGGMMRLLISEFHVGQVPRPLHELVVTLTARKRGLPVVEPLGAGVQWAGPGIYRGWFLTRALEGQTLWDLLVAGGDPDVRRAALHQTRVAIDLLHEGGLDHADLNFHNLFVRTARRPLQVIMLDLDKARLYPGALPQTRRLANFSRLARSAHKLEKAGAILTPEERTMLGLIR
jgi:Lipopolysaccharide kinase (Kdo/WaaP) family